MTQKVAGMSQIEELQTRISAAMDRIGAGVDTLANRQIADGAGQGDADLTAALDEEKLANAQLEERLKAIKARHEAEMAALREDLDKSEEMTALRAEADTLRTEAATLKEEMAALRVELDQAAKAADLQAELDKARAEAETQAASMAELDLNVQRVRQANDQLREVNGKLRDANAEGVGEPDLINKAMEAEIEGLRATRAADAAEAGAVLSKLETVLANARHLPEGEED